MDVQEFYNTSKHDQFLLKLCSKFEVAQGALLNRNPVPSLDACVSELLKEEQCLLTQGTVSVDATLSELVTVVYVALSRGKSDMR